MKIKYTKPKFRTFETNIAKGDCGFGGSVGGPDCSSSGSAYTGGFCSTGDILGIISCNPHGITASNCSFGGSAEAPS